MRVERIYSGVQAFTTEFPVNYFRIIAAKLSRSAKKHPSYSARIMRRVVRGLSIYVYQFLIPTHFQAQFQACAARGAGVVGTSTYPSIPNTNNVMRP
jgi:hypothetical protein